MIGMDYITLTNKRNELLKKKLKQEKYPKITVKFLNKTLEIETHDIQNKTAPKPNVKLTSNYLKELSNKLTSYQEKMHSICREKFLEKIAEYDSKYNETLKVITNYS